MSKAISPVIASILMMVIIVAIIIIFFGFTTGFLGGASSSTVEKGLGLTSSSSVGQIEAINVSGSEIYLRVTNDVSSDLDSVFIDSNKIVCDGLLRTLTPGVIDTVTLNSTNCPGLTVTGSSVVVVTGSNSFRATGVAGAS